MNAHVPLAAFSATMKARLRKEPGLYFDNIATSPSTVSGAFPLARLLTSAYAPPRVDMILTERTLTG
jgi:hypothetical protein